MTWNNFIVLHSVFNKLVGAMLQYIYFNFRFFLSSKGEKKTFFLFRELLEYIYVHVSEHIMGANGREEPRLKVKYIFP
jgi:hypothetical protein